MESEGVENCVIIFQDGGGGGCCCCGSLGGDIDILINGVGAIVLLWLCGRLPLHGKVGRGIPDGI